MRRSWGGRVGSRTISLTSTAATGTGAVLGCCCAQTGCPSPAFAIAAYCSATIGRPCAALLGASPVGSVLALARPLDVAATPHISSAPGSPSSCNPLPGDAGPAVEGSPIVGPVGPIAADCFRVGATGSAHVYAGSAGGANGSPMRLSLLAADGCSSSINSTLEQATIR